MLNNYMKQKGRTNDDVMNCGRNFPPCEMVARLGKEEMGDPWLKVDVFDGCCLW